MNKPSLTDTSLKSTLTKDWVVPLMVWVLLEMATPDTPIAETEIPVGAVGSVV